MGAGYAAVTKGLRNLSAFDDKKTGCVID